MVAGQGFEPRFLVPETNVLPLDDPALNTACRADVGYYNRQSVKFKLSGNQAVG